jgi:hypothetical protein
MSTIRKQQHDTEPKDAPPAWVGVVRQKVESLRFGVVQIVVHDSKVLEEARRSELAAHGTKASDTQAARKPAMVPRR